jgi:hypothetical protein
VSATRTSQVKVRRKTLNYAAAAHIKPKIIAINKDLTLANLQGTKSSMDIKELTTH